MSSVFKAWIVQIGNFQGVRIPKILLEQISLGEEAELELQPDQIVIRPARQAREGWDRAFQAMAEHGDDRLLDDAPASTLWDEDEWQW